MIRNNNELKLFNHLRIFKVILIILITIVSPMLVFEFSNSEELEETTNQPPVANPGLDVSEHPISNTVEVLKTVFFNGRESYDPDPEDTLNYHWDFGDSETSNLVSPTHIYDQIGAYVVSLTVNDSLYSNTANLTIFVMSEGNHEPIAIIKVDTTKDDKGNNYANISESIRFDATESFDPDGFPLNYEWDFDDGKTGSKSIETHKYSKDDVYTVILTVTDHEMHSSKDYITIKIGTGSSKSSNDNKDSTDDATGLGILVLGITIVIIILLILFWLYLGNLRKRTAKRVETISVGKSTPKEQAPPIPTFAKPDVQQRDALSRRTRVDRLAGSEAQMKRAIMRDKLQHERKKLDDDMKKELEDLGIEI